MGAPADGGAPPVLAPGTYVSSVRGSDNNPGTPAAPLKSIGKGVQNARGLLALGAQSVFVAEGHYPERIILVEGISLLGGHECNAASCSWARNPPKYDAAIDNVDDEGVIAPAGVTRRTRLDGFRVRGRNTPFGSPGSACVTILGGTPTIANNVIALGNNGGNQGGNSRAVGIDLVAPGGAEPGGALITGNTINGGNGGNNVVGILFGSRPNLPPGNGVVATVTSNVIRGGGAQGWTGIAAWSSADGTLVQGNQITGGSSTAYASWGIQVESRMTIDGNRINLDQAAVGACAGTGWCGGIASLSATAVVTNNIVFGNKGQRTTAVFLMEAEKPAGSLAVNGNLLDGGGGPAPAGASPTMSTAVVLRIGDCTSCGFTGFVGRLRNNILLGGQGNIRQGVMEEAPRTRTMHPEALDNNAFFFAPRLVPALGNDILYRLWNGTTWVPLMTTADIQAQVPSKTPPTNNLQADPMLDATYHIARTSPLVDKGTATEAPARDFDNETRPKGIGIDIGHDEAM
jgi:hypothetical protein